MQAVKAPKQARSRHTLHRLLAAAEALLEHGGLDAATVPAIAEAAGVSVGVVYRRFPDKDALLRAVYERFFKTMSDQNTMRLQSIATREVPFETLARGIVLGMIEGYRRKRGLIRALTRYARTHPDREFRRAAKQMNRATMFAILNLMLSHRKKIHHPNPEIAIEFALITIASVLQNVIIEEEPLVELQIPAHLDDEVVRLFFGYLGIDETKQQA